MVKLPVQPLRRGGMVTGWHVRRLLPPQDPGPGVQTVPHVVCATTDGALTRARETAMAVAMFTAKRMVVSSCLTGGCG